MTTSTVLAQLPARSALVVGDICLDRWCSYDPAASEPSRETGIPRTAVVSTEVTPGAGGTVANNLAALGVGRVAVLGAVGDDGFGYELRQALAARRIDSHLLVTVPGLQTFTYTKVINAQTGVEDQRRIDFINSRPLAPKIEAQLVERFRAEAGAYDVILVSDQAETGQAGVVTAALREEALALACRHTDKVVWVDSRLRPELFRHVIVKPNQQEAEVACRRLFGRVDYSCLRAYVEAPLLIVTHGGDGVMIVDVEGEHWVRTRRVEKPVDICGAGDSFSAAAAMALAVSGDIEASVRLGNLVASITIMKKGTGTASPAEVLATEGMVLCDL
jgi:rfaE bifunctional protein kinase chain/domain